MENSSLYWRELLYPLGFLSSLAFSARFLLQWIQSEKLGKSVVSKGFWKISLFGNIALMVHSFIQVQSHVCLIQACNAVISWRNLELMGPADKRARLLTVFALFASVLTLIPLAFFLQGDEWFRTPFTDEQLPWGWHAIGMLGLLLFNCRFWVQWWQAERSQESTLNAPFWWMSLTGAILSVIYFSLLKDPVNLVGPLVGLIPYIRNLMLLKKNKQEQA